MKRSFKKRLLPRSPARPGSKADATKDAILRAAMRVLARDGFPALTARNVAAEAGTNLALLNYHFGSKERLLLAIYDALDAARIARQRRIYGEPGEPLSAKWRHAVAFYRSDLADGYVRVVNELTAYGYSNTRVRRRVRLRLGAWRLLLTEVAREHLPALGIRADPAEVASAVASFWLGMETQHLIGVTEVEGTFFAILDEVGDWLEREERRATLGRPGGRVRARVRAI